MREAKQEGVNMYTETLENHLKIQKLSGHTKVYEDHYTRYAARKAEQEEAFRVAYQNLAEVATQLLSQLGTPNAEDESLA